MASPAAAASPPARPSRLALLPDIFCSSITLDAVYRRVAKRHSKTETRKIEPAVIRTERRLRSNNLRKSRNPGSLSGTRSTFYAEFGTGIGHTPVSPLHAALGKPYRKSSSPGREPETTRL